MQVPLIIPNIVIIVGSYLIVAPIVTDPAIEYVYILAVFLVGFVVYVPFVYFKYSLRYLGNALLDISIHSLNFTDTP